MFDDLNNQASQPSQQPGSSANPTPPDNAAGAPPAGLPTQEPAGAAAPPATEKPLVQPDTPVEDIFSRVDSSAPVPPPASASSADIPPADPTQSPTSQTQQAFSDHVSSDRPSIPRPQLNIDGEGSSKKKYFIIGIVSLIVIVGGYVAYLNFFAADPLADGPEVDQVTVPLETVTPPPATTPVNIPEPLTPTPTPPVEQINDTDGDGLNDEDEFNLFNTDPERADTDQDGLTDSEEILQFKTDPRNPDTDNDSYLDGEEVLNGFNPLGDGLLQETL